VHDNLTIVKIFQEELYVMYFDGCFQGTVECLEPCSDCTKCSDFKKKM
jgi:hypothetical protein